MSQYSQMGISVPPMTKINKVIIIVAVGVFLLQSLLGMAGIGSLFSHYLSLSPHNFFNGHFYEIFTYSFVQTGLFQLIFDCLLIWFLGGELEQYLTSKRYLFFLVSMVLITGGLYLIASVFFGGASFPLLGLTGLSFALLVCYGLFYPERPLMFMMIFPLKAKYFCLLLAGIEFYMAFFSQKLSALAYLLSMICVFPVLQFMRTQFVVNLLNSNIFSFSGKKLFQKKKARKSHLRIVTENDDEKPDSKNHKYWQ